MQHRRLGMSGLQVSVFGLGSWLTLGQRVGQRETTAIVRAALDAGVTFIDTADVYGRGAAESAIGVALEGVDRHHYVLASKCFFPMSDHPFDKGLSRKHVRASVEASLTRLATDHLDLYQCHRFDPATPLDEIVRTMDDLVSAGKILHWGVSHWTGAQIADACDIARKAGREAPISNQPPYNLLDRAIEPEVLPRSSAAGVGQVVFSPLAQGVLTGKYSGGSRPKGTRAADKSVSFFLDRYFEPRTLDAVARADAMARKAGTTLPKVALQWCLRNENVASVIVGVSNEAQLKENLAAFTEAIPADVIAAVDAATLEGAVA